MNGILALDKPAGWSSRDAVNRVARLVRPTKAGHAGTLDPIATGVLVVCVGAATRLIEYVQQQPKAYRADFRLGERSPSDDVELPSAPVVGAPVPTRAALEAAVAKFRGVVQQRPPAYSAVKVAGQRAYALARRGEAPLLAPRAVEIYGLEVVAFDYPRLVLEVRCSSGTYVRALGRDVAESLGTAAVMTALVRTAVGGFRLDDAAPAEALTLETLVARLQPPEAALGCLPRVVLSESECRATAQGQLIERGDLAGDAAAAYDAGGRLLAILKPVGDGRWRPSPNFSQPS